MEDIDIVSWYMKEAGMMDHAESSHRRSKIEIVVEDGKDSQEIKKIEEKEKENEKALEIQTIDWKDEFQRLINLKIEKDRLKRLSNLQIVELCLNAGDSSELKSRMSTGRIYYNEILEFNRAINKNEKEYAYENMVTFYECMSNFVMRIHDNTLYILALFKDLAVRTQRIDIFRYAYDKIKSLDKIESYDDILSRILANRSLKIETFHVDESIEIEKIKILQSINIISPV